MSNQEHWKIFKKGDAHASKLLSRLYGQVNDGDNAISYPKIKTKSRPLDGRHEWNVNKQSKEKRERAKMVKVPVVGKGKEQADQADKLLKLGRKKDIQACMKELQITKSLTSTYRPPATIKDSSEVAKVKLQESFQRGGKALPDDLLPKLESAKKTSIVEPKENSSKSLATQIYDEIVERRTFQAQMEKIGEGGKTRAKVTEEIAERVKQLHRLDKHLAKKVMSKDI